MSCLLSVARLQLGFMDGVSVETFGAGWMGGVMLVFEDVNNCYQSTKGLLDLYVPWMKYHQGIFKNGPDEQFFFLIYFFVFSEWERFVNWYLNNSIQTFVFVMFI